MLAEEVRLTNHHMRQVNRYSMDWFDQCRSMTRDNVRSYFDVPPTTESVGKEIEVVSEKGHVLIKAATSIELTVGSSTLSMDSSGNISLNGKVIATSASEEQIIKGGMVCKVSHGSQARAARSRRRSSSAGDRDGASWDFCGAAMPAPVAGSPGSASIAMTSASRSALPTVGPGIAQSRLAM